MGALGESGLIKSFFPGGLYFGGNGRALAEGMWEGRVLNDAHQEAPWNWSGPENNARHQSRNSANQGLERAPKSAIRKN